MKVGVPCKSLWHIDLLYLLLLDAAYFSFPLDHSLCNIFPLHTKGLTLISFLFTKGRADIVDVLSCIFLRQATFLIYALYADALPVNMKLFKLTGKGSLLRQPPPNLN